MKQKPIVKKRKRTLKSVALDVITLAGFGAMIVGAFYGDVLITVKSQNLLDFEEVNEYKINQEVAPGYYNEHPLIISIDNSFTKYQKNQIIKGIQYVDKVAEGLKFIIVEGNHKDSDIKIGIDNEMSSLGIAYPRRKEIYINTKSLHHMGIQSTLIHELAHILGLEHSKNITSLMYPVGTRFKFSQEDINNINTIWPAKDEEPVK